MARQREDLTGKTYNLLTVLRHVSGQRWLCKCKCGEETAVLSYALKSGTTRSCGCLRRKRHAPMIIICGLSLPYGVEAYDIGGERVYIVWDMRDPDVHPERARFNTAEEAIAWNAANPL